MTDELIRVIEAEPDLAAILHEVARTLLVLNRERVNGSLTLHLQDGQLRRLDMRRVWRPES